jgi:lysozyme
MNLGAAGTALIQSFENCELAAYPDGNGVPTIGWGHTAGVKLGDTCTAAQADQWFFTDTGAACRSVTSLVDIAITQSQFDALVSLCFNIGAGHFCSSTLLRVLNAGNLMAAADQFLVWDVIAGQPSPGLQRRRAAERALFVS